MSNIDDYMNSFTSFLNECDKKIFITADEIMSSGFFEDIEEVNVFFISLNGHDYMTYNNAAYYMSKLPQVINNTTDLF